MVFIPFFYFFLSGDGGGGSILLVSHAGGGEGPGSGVVTHPGDGHQGGSKVGELSPSKSLLSPCGVSKLQLPSSQNPVKICLAPAYLEWMLVPRSPEDLLLFLGLHSNLP